MYYSLNMCGLHFYSICSLLWNDEPMMRSVILTVNMFSIIAGMFWRPFFFIHNDLEHLDETKNTIKEKSVKRSKYFHYTMCLSKMISFINPVSTFL